MISRFYQTELTHRRSTPAVHEFGYRVPVFVFDLAELESGLCDNALFRFRPTGGHDGMLPRPLGVHGSDYLYEGPDGLREKLARVLEAGGLAGSLAQGRVLLATSARFLGYGFNPVNFWLVYAPNRALACAVAEVNNTFGEKHVYILGNGQPQTFPAVFRAAKAFHVSPFNDLRGEYRFSIANGLQGVDIRVDLLREGTTVMEARLRAVEAGRPVTAAGLAAFLLHPQRVLTFPRILAQAARIRFRRRLPLHEKPYPASPMTIRHTARSRPGMLGRLACHVLQMLLARAESGSLLLHQPDGSSRRFSGSAPGPRAELHVHDRRFYSALARSGDIGFGEAYTKGWWDSPDLEALLCFLALNQERMRLASALGLPAQLPAASRGLRRLGGSRNHRPGARRNILAHYDLGDRLFQHILDPTMAYSCALFEHEDATLQQAQEAKFRRIAERLELTAGDRVLEIGCGWGGFALWAARTCGCRVEGVTISDNQLAYAKRRAGEQGLRHLVSFRLQDYRDIRQTYDKVISIEMLEAVGHAYHKLFFDALERLVAPRGLALVQFIAIRDQRYDSYRFQGDWIRKHIFPGGLLPSLARVLQLMARRTTFTARSVESFAPDYARTLALWRENMQQNAQALEALGYDAAFRRTWEYYFTYCQAGFACRVIDDYQLLLGRPLGVAPKQPGGHRHGRRTRN